MVLPLTLTHAYEVAEHLCAPHRADVLRDNASVWAWARAKIEQPGVAFACVRERALFVGGVETEQPEMGFLWLAGTEGWTRYVKHAIKVARAILSSGTYLHYRCEVYEADQVSRRFAEHLGFREIKTSDGLVIYGVTP